MQTFRYVVFTLNEQRFGLPLGSVVRVIPVVEITLLPGPPEVVSGVINYQGRVMTVFNINIRRRFGSLPRDIELTDRLIIVNTSGRTVAFLVDTVTGMVECPEDEVAGSKRIIKGLEQIESAVKSGDGLVLTHDSERFLSAAEKGQLDKALKEKGAG